MPPLRPTACERARAHLSLALDGELSELGSARLDAHVAECPACAAYGADIARMAGFLRGAALEQPTAPIELPRARRLNLRGFQVAAAAASVAVVAAVGGMSLSLLHGGSQQAASAPELRVPANAVFDSSDVLDPAKLRASEPRQARHAGIRVPI